MQPVRVHRCAGAARASGMVHAARAARVARRSAPARPLACPSWARSQHRQGDRCASRAAASAMYPVAPRHNACLGPGVVSAAQMPLDAAAAYNAATNSSAAAPALIRPMAGGPAFSVQPSDPAKHTTCVARCAERAAEGAGGPTLRGADAARRPAPQLPVCDRHLRAGHQVRGRRDDGERHAGCARQRSALFGSPRRVVLTRARLARDAPGAYGATKRYKSIQRIKARASPPCAARCVVRSTRADATRLSLRSACGRLFAGGRGRRDQRLPVHLGAA